MGQFILSVLVGVAAVVAAYHIFFWQLHKNKKMLHFSGKSFELAPSLPEVLSDKIKVRHGWRETIVPMVCLLRVKSTGRSPILPGDFDGPLFINFGNPSILMGGQIIMDPPGIIKPGSDDYSWDSGRLSMAPFLLNPGDQMGIVSLVDGGIEPPSVETRIAGVREAVAWPPFGEGVTAKFNIQSLVYKYRNEWPEGPVIALVKRRVAALPSGYMPDDVSFSLDGLGFKDPYLVSISPLGEYGNLAFDGPLQIKFLSSRISAVKVELEGELLDRLSVYSLQGERGEEISISQISMNQSYLCFHLLFDGDPGGIEVKSMPTCIKDVQIGEMDFGELLDGNIEEIPSSALVFNHATFGVLVRVKDNLWRGLKKMKDFLK